MKKALPKSLLLIALFICAKVCYSQILTDSITFKSTIYGVDLSSNGSLIFVAGKDSTLSVWNEDKISELNLKDYQGPISSVSYFDKEGMILTGSYGNSAILWDLKGKPKATLTHEKAIINIAQNDQFLATASRDNTSKIWDMEGNLLYTLKGHTSQVNDILFVEERQWIVTASFDKTIKLWNYEGQLLKSYEVQSSGIRSVRVSISNELIITGHRDGSLSYSKLDGSLIKTISAHGLAGEEYRMINDIGIINETKIITAGADGFIRLWDIQGNMISETKAAPAKDAYVSGLAISGQKMVTSSGGENPMIKIWDLSSID